MTSGESESDCEDSDIQPKPNMTFRESPERYCEDRHVIQPKPNVTSGESPESDCEDSVIRTKPNMTSGESPESDCEDNDDAADPAYAQNLYSYVSLYL